MKKFKLGKKYKMKSVYATIIVSGNMR